uniref:tRNA-intron lyase n=1 Tax=Panagrolaimus superbus TaxID=310955 RepID=A0A914YZC6_9BILA
MEADPVIPKLLSVDSEALPGPSSSSAQNDNVEDDYFANQILSLIPLTDDDPERIFIANKVFDFISFPSEEFACFEVDCFSLISRHFRIFGCRDPCIAVAISREPRNPYAPVIYTPEQVGLLQDIGHARILRNAHEERQDAIHYEIKGDDKFREIDEKELRRARSATIGRKRKAIMKNYADVPKAKRPKISDDQIEVTDEEIIETCNQFLEERGKRPFTPLVSLSDSLIPQDSSCFPKTEAFRRKSLVFKNLWQRGFYLSCGLKFACDFLVYEGQPGKVHSSYVCHVKSVNDDISFKWMQLHGRIAKSVKKEILIAFVDDFGEVYYQKQSYWNESSMGKGAPKRHKPFNQEEVCYEDFIDKNKKATATCWEDLES